ncbi:pantoate--beta-alanine ligase [Pinisolibacter aquiterrae]|uniref:pantoate--beta-alanine ligase n=1 Tax=Pinisolibacter aquiterrae TaxID=2815579 RepID=UPI001C3E85AB|nr:pantoate--beta-alanine ligase [Pinisolibacter aquiterrae]MBV5264013.1 pantoate--beta-alanine ligase [Pinisolibacter aquiterrae]MCC8233892.1 pantoate--beta-alanine ligase [Pinisolibacter aquiterrae]
MTETVRRPAIVRTIADLRARVARWRAAGETVALVPTMGALHDGHLSLVADGFRRADHVVVSIFVNPTQFAPHEDFQTYPRTEGPDVEKLAGLGTDLVFAPSALEMYPLGNATRLEMAGPAVGLESDFRPHFFGGVATVVAKLLIACGPDFAIFGEKDYQQLAVVRQMVSDLALPVTIVGATTVRETDGLALSSRNAYLSAEERAIAPTLFAEMSRVAEVAHAKGDVTAACAAAGAALLAAGFRQIDYVAVRNAVTLAAPSGEAGEPLRVLVAAWLGKTRLIDNMAA